ncbi:MAG: Co2+/Mg2+ efflux protein ApaG [Leeuwenhoekiella sp.]
MVEQITNGIKVSVVTHFEGTFNKGNQNQFAFGYRVTIENKSTDDVKLLSRYWIIMDALNATEIVIGDGVIGLQPVLRPGEVHTYNSGCLLHATSGAMRGHYVLKHLSTGKKFKVKIPTFNLHAPYTLN